MKSSASSKPSSPLHSSYVSPSSTPPHTHQSFSDTLMEESMDEIETIVAKWDLTSVEDNNFISIFAGDDRNEAAMFLKAVANLHSAMHYFVKKSSSSEKLIKAQRLTSIAMKRLEKEFDMILSENKKILGTESEPNISDFNEDDIVSDQMIPRAGNFISASRVAMADLKNIADSMIGSGYGKECVSNYKIIRKSIIDETLYYLGVENLSPSQIQKMDWNLLEPKIKCWLNAVRVAVKNLFYGERILCDYIFSSSEDIIESCFTEISKDAALTLFNFPENVAKSKKNHSPEKIFRALDLYEAVSELWPEIESIFSHGSLSPVRSQAVAAQVKLGEAVRTMLSQFEDAIQKDSSKSSSSGGVHPLTRYVMNFLIFIGDYSAAVSDIVADWPMNAHPELPESYFSSHATDEETSAAAITERLAWLILVLLCKLDTKAVLYNDVTLSYFFLANNLNYVVSKVKNSSLGLLMGPDWIYKNGSKVKQYLANYEKMAWSKVTSSLPDNPTAEISPQESMECLKRFNLGFEEAHNKQSSWVIPDPKLRDDVRHSLARKIIPRYRVFYYKHIGEYSVGQVIKFSPEDLDNCLSTLFSVVQGAGNTSSHDASPEPSFMSRWRR